MELAGSVVVVTGGASGIGLALASRFVVEGAAAVVIADVDPRVDAVAASFGAHAARCDVSSEADVVALIDSVEATHGPIDLFCANAGIGSAGGVEVGDDAWNRIWSVNVMSHVYSSRALIPRMSERGGGYLLHTASAAGLLTNPGAAAYSVTKHAALALAEWIAITYGAQGIKISCLCPQGVNTPLLTRMPGELASRAVAAQGVIEPDQVADSVVQGLLDERFLILPHPEVREYAIRRATDHGRWISAMQRMIGRVAQTG